jgi:hypothetical protein
MKIWSPRFLRVGRLLTSITVRAIVSAPAPWTMGDVAYTVNWLLSLICKALAALDIEAIRAPLALVQP